MYVYESLINGYTVDEIAEEMVQRGGFIKIIKGAFNRVAQFVIGIIKKIKSKINSLRGISEYDYEDDNSKSSSKSTQSSNSSKDIQLMSKYCGQLAKFHSEAQYIFKSLYRNNSTPKELQERFEQLQDFTKECIDTENNIRSITVTKTNIELIIKQLNSIINELERLASLFKNNTFDANKDDFEYYENSSDEAFKLMQSYSTKMCGLVNNVATSANKLVESIH